MSILNSIVIEGRVNGEIAYSENPKGNPEINFVIASNYYFQNLKDPEVSFFKVEAWNRTARMCKKHLHCWNMVRVYGRLRQDRWVDEKGKIHSEVKIIAEEIDFRNEL